MKHETITPNEKLSEQQLAIMLKVDDVVKSPLVNKHDVDYRNTYLYKLQTPQQMTQTDIHYVKIEIELRYPDFEVYQREHTLLITFA